MNGERKTKLKKKNPPILEQVKKVIGQDFLTWNENKASIFLEENPFLCLIGHSAYWRKKGTEDLSTGMIFFPSSR